MNRSINNSISQAHIAHFSEAPSMYWAPGRINLIGEHIDYNGGLVLPGAVDLGLFIAISLGQSHKCRITAVNLNEIDSCDLDGTKGVLPWMRYFQNVLKLFAEQGLKISSIDCTFGGDLPIGAGMSSSSAITCGFIYALNDLFHIGLSRVEMVNMASIVEHAGGVDGGKMDQYSIMFGEKDKLLAVDTKLLSHRYVDATLNDFCLLLLHSGVVHDLQSTEYNKRRNDCRSGLLKLRGKGVEADTVCDLSNSDIQDNQQCLSDNEFRRLRYAVNEHRRVREAIKALDSGDMLTLGNLLYESHDGLKNEYNVSCEEVDYLIELTELSPFVLGARMMGGGFGGCTINLVKRKYMDSVVEELQRLFTEKFNVKPQPYAVNISDGIRKTS